MNLKEEKLVFFEDKITDSQIDQITAYLKGGVSLTNIAKTMKISMSDVIYYNKKWNMLRKWRWKV